MRRALPWLSFLLALACCGADDDSVKLEAEQNDTEQALSSDRVAELKAQVIAIASANTTKTNNLAAVRAQLDPLVAELRVHFAQNRPENEAQLVRGTWKSLWYDNPDIDDRGPFVLKRNKIYQVVEKDFYVNVSELDFNVGGVSLGAYSSFLRGNYRITDPATDELRAAGTERLNVISLKFADNRTRPGALPKASKIRKLANQASDGNGAWTVPVPGPRGERGELWNVYLDDTLRVSLGIDLRTPEREDLYVLVRP